MSQEPSSSWYVVHTRHMQDRLCADALERKGFAVYMPMRQTCVRHARREEVVMRPAFGRYLFVGLDSAAPRFADVKRTLGVEWMVSGGKDKHPQAVAGEIVDAIRAAEQAGAFDDMSRTDTPLALPRRGERLKIVAGPFAGMIAEIVNAPSANRVEIIIRHAMAFSKIVLPLDKLSRNTLATTS